MTEDKQKILIVDDERFNINMLVEILESDYETRVAKNGEQALKRARSSNPPDLILLDVMMPDMDGYEVCRRLKADPATRDIPVIFVTAKSEESDELEGLKLGAVDYITKPLSLPIVQNRVRLHLNLRRAYRNLSDANKRLERQNIELVEADKLKQEVDLIMRHDLKTPLNSIIGYSTVLLGDETLPASTRDNLGIIHDSGVKALHMITLSLGLYRMERGIYAFNPKEVDLLHTIRTIRDNLSEMIHNDQLTLEVRVDGQPVPEDGSFIVWGEKMLCYSMMANLIKNALEASPELQTVTVSLRGGEESATIRIHNQGAVPENIRETFFEKFTTAGKSTGTGLGTYSAKMIAETQGGAIHMRSSEAEGTEITVTIPTKKTGVTARPMTPSTPRPAPLERATPPASAEPATTDPRALRQKVVAFLDEAPDHLRMLKEAVEKRDGDRAMREVVWLKVATRVFNLRRVSVLSIRLKGIIEVEEWPEAQTMCEKLERALAMVRENMDGPAGG